MANLKNTLIDKNSIETISLTVNNDVAISGGTLYLKNGVIETTGTTFNLMDSFSYGATYGNLFGNCSSVTLFKDTAISPTFEIRGSDGAQGDLFDCVTLCTTNYASPYSITSINTMAWDQDISINNNSTSVFENFCSIDLIKDGNVYLLFRGTDDNKNIQDICAFDNIGSSFYSDSLISTQQEAIRGTFSINNQIVTKRDGTSWMTKNSSNTIKLPGYLKILNSSFDTFAFTQNSDVLDGCIAIEQTSDTNLDYEGGLTIVDDQYATSDWTMFVGANNVGNALKGYLGFRYTRGTSPYGNTNITAYINPNAVFTKMNFTGQHRSIGKQQASFYKQKIGLIVVASGDYSNFYGNDNSVNEAIPIVDLSSSRMQKSAFGVISNIEEEQDNVRSYVVGNWGFNIDKQGDENRVIINSIGEGGIWVTNVNGNLENGDYITTCEIPGYGMKQDSEFLHNYTVAKITCDCDFDLNSPIYMCEEFQWEGQTFRRAFVGCTYHCG